MSGELRVCLRLASLYLPGTTGRRPSDANAEIMKLLLCPDCGDVFKLVIYGARSCLCGKTKGVLVDDNHAVINGEGISMMIDNLLLLKAMKRLEGMDQNKPEGYYKKYADVACHVRPNSGPGNPRTKVIKSLFDTSAGEILTPDKIAYRARRISR
jgi:hypothetical protein